MKRRTARALVTACAAIALGASATAGASIRAGGTVATALPIALGRTVHGDNLSASCMWGQFWTLPLRGGDSTTLTWNVSNLLFNPHFYVYAPGLDDSNLAQAKPLVDSTPNDSYVGKAQWVAAAAGTYYLRFDTDNTCNGDEFLSGSGGPGTYLFTVAVLHAVRVSAALRGRAVSRSAPLEVTATDLQGNPVTGSGLGYTVEGFWSKQWTTIGKGTLRRGTAAAKLSLPPTLGGTIQVRISVSGAGYLPASVTYRGIKIG
jgi:hypothetical protein